MKTYPEESFARLAKLEAGHFWFEESNTDVLEHILDDQLAIANLYGCLKPSGTLVATVPQHPALWNLHDEQACHARRYKSHELQDKITTAGFNVCYSTSFMTALLPLMVLRKMRKGHKEASAQDAGEFRPHPAVNRTLRLILGIEQMFIRCGLRLPIGGSRLVVAKKK